MITREDEANFPDFKTVLEAKQYFRKRYGKSYPYKLRLPSLLEGEM
ncbi:hypothetical protein [Aliarcobacter cibarius]|nr:hypothetical protein [Aliarcobacter cibarius]